MTIQISFDEAKRLVEEAIAEKGEDYVYEADLLDGQKTCAYFNPDRTPGCIVGHVLVKLGVTVDDLAAVEYEDGSPDGLNHFASVEALSSTGFLAMEDGRTLDYLAWIQQEQDRGEPWGAARHEALRRLSERYGDSPE